MTDDKRAGEGPYRIEAFQACEPWKRLVVVGPSVRVGENGVPPNSGELLDLLNIAYAEGRKAAETDFRELLDLANRMVAPAGPKFQAVTDLKSWKKVRGLE